MAEQEVRGDGMSAIQRFERNTKGRDLVIGDVHGHFDKAMAALLSVGFDPAVDRVFSVGDLVDRGPESLNVIDWLQKPWFHAVRGNHEQMCIERVESYMHNVNGGAWFTAMTMQEQQPYVDAMDRLPWAIEVETERGLVGIVHADPVADDWSRVRQIVGSKVLSRMEVEGFRQALIWSRERVNSGFDGDVAGVRAVVVGHTPMDRWSSLGNVIYVDTGGWLPEHRFPGRAFTVLDLATLMPADSPVREVTA